MRVLLLRHDAARARETVRYLDVAELEAVPNVTIGREPPKVAREDGEAGGRLLDMVARKLTRVT